MLTELTTPTPSIHLLMKTLYPVVAVRIIVRLRRTIATLLRNVKCNAEVVGTIISAGIQP